MSVHPGTYSGNVSRVGQTAHTCRQILYPLSTNHPKKLTTTPARPSARARVCVRCVCARAHTHTDFDRGNKHTHTRARAHTHPRTPTHTHTPTQTRAHMFHSSSSLLSTLRMTCNTARKYMLLQRQRSCTRMKRSIYCQCTASKS